MDTKIIVKFSNVAGYERQNFVQFIEQKNENTWILQEERIVYTGSGRIYCVFEVANDSISLSTLIKKVMSFGSNIYNNRKVKVSISDIKTMKEAYLRYINKSKNEEDSDDLSEIETPRRKNSSESLISPSPSIKSKMSSSSSRTKLDRIENENIIILKGFSKDPLPKDLTPDEILKVFKSLTSSDTGFDQSNSIGVVEIKDIVDKKRQY